MPDVSADQKQKAKTAAANAALASNDLAVVFGAAGVVAASVGAVSGVGAPAGIGVGAVLGLASFAAWYMGNRYQRLANDPPRDDFQTVTVSGASYVENLSIGEPTASLRVLGGEHFVFGDAMSALVLSLERYDGAISAGDSDTAQGQADAVQENAAAANASLQRIRLLANSINDSWSSYAANADWSQASIEAARRLLTDTNGSDVNAPGAPLADLLTRVQGIDASTILQPLADDQHPLFAAPTLPDKPDKLVSDAFLAAMEEASSALSALGAPFANV